MLSCDENMAAMDPTRRQHMPAMIREAICGDAGPMADTPLGVLVRFTLGGFWNSIFPRTMSMVFEVCQKWVAAQKAAAKRAGEVAYISTNDVLVSAYMRCFHPPPPPRDATATSITGLMSINFRGRVPGLGDDAIGNYEELMAYAPADFATPVLIRRSVSGPCYRRARRVLLRACRRSGRT